MSTTASSQRLLARLYRELKELLEQPYPGVAVFTDDADIRKFCLVLSPPSGPWKGLNLHFDVILPHDWPSQPPKVVSSVAGIDHPNLLWGGYICCDLLNPDSWLEEGYTGGYSPALTLRGLFLQFLTFFSSTKVEQDYGGVVEIGDYSSITYVEEKHLDPIWLGNSSEQAKRHIPSHRANHLVLKALWEADTGEEITLYRSAPTGQIVHTVKGDQPGPDRIHKFEKINKRWAQTLKLISGWVCRKCPYGTATLPHNGLGSQACSAKAEPVSPFLSPPHSLLLDHLNDDILLEIANYLSSESLISFGKAYPHFHALTTSYHVLLQREVHCFFMKTRLVDGILGIGIAFDPFSRTLSSDFDWLSLEAFDVHNVRKSIQKRNFKFFLPLAFNQPHFERAKLEIWKRLRILDREVREVDFARNRRQLWGSRRRVAGVPPLAQPQDAVKVIYTMMNNIVVSLMKSCDGAYDVPGRSTTSGISMASERAIISYCHLMHLLMCLSRAWPVILRDAVYRLKAFLRSPSNRTKAVEPDLGELIVVITLVLIMSPPNLPNSPTWAMFNGPFLEESITRNARWVLKEAPQLEVMEEGPSDYRLNTTFKKSKTSLRLLMFQVTFSDLFIKTYQKVGIRALDENYGFPVNELPEMMVQEIKEIYKVDSWPMFFWKVRWAKARTFTKRQFSGMLRDAIRKSRERGYHRAASPDDLEELRYLRASLEEKAAEAALAQS